MKTLYKICCQSSHFVFGFFRMDAASPAASSSSSSSSHPPVIPHCCMFELHCILEDWITENTTGVLSLTSRKGTASLVKIDCNQRRITGITTFLGNLKETRGTVDKVNGSEASLTYQHSELEDFFLTWTLCACSKKCTTTLHLLQAILHFGPDVGSRTRTPLSHSTHCPMPKELRECWQDGWVHSLQPIPRRSTKEKELGQQTRDISTRK